MIGICAAQAETDGQDFWAVKGVGKGNVLNLHAALSTAARKNGSDSISKGQAAELHHLADHATVKSSAS
jgi:hypothetical protein